MNAMTTEKTEMIKCDTERIGKNNNKTTTTSDRKFRAEIDLISHQRQTINFPV